MRDAPEPPAGRTAPLAPDGVPDADDTDVPDADVPDADVPATGDTDVPATGDAEALTPGDADVRTPAPGVPDAATPRGGSHRSGTAGARCTTGPWPAADGSDADGSAAAGCSSPVTGRPGNGCCAVPPPSSALERPSRTACEAVPMKAGFCQVGSRPPNPRSATPAGLGASARWIGGSADQAAGATARPPPAATSPPEDPAPEDDTSPPEETVPEDDTSPPEETAPEDDPSPPGDPAPSPPPEDTDPEDTSEPPEDTAPGDTSPPSSARPRNRSRNPTAQPSAPARVTRDAISPV
ncbi:hypothetical protein GTW59_24280 [Streptomyces sp. SID89]|nr:hypothetical protein [Streptomyces sp. SID89]